MGLFRIEGSSAPRIRVLASWQAGQVWVAITSRGAATSELLLADWLGRGREAQVSTAREREIRW